MSKYMGQIMAECDCQHKACEVRGHCLADYIKELEAQLVGMSVSHWQVEPMQQNSPLHDALTRAETAEAKLAKAVEALNSMAILPSHGYIKYFCHKTLAEIEGVTHE